MDAIDDRLKDLIVYINQNSQFDIYAVQMEYYKFEKYETKYEIMIPKLFGVEVKKSMASSPARQRKKWDEQSFIIQAKELLGEGSGKMLKLYELFKQKSDKINWGTGANLGSFSPIINKIDATISPFSIFSNGFIEVKFSWVYHRTGRKEIKEIADSFFHDIAEAGVKVNQDCLDLKDNFRLQEDEFIKNFDIIFKAISNLLK